MQDSANESSRTVHERMQDVNKLIFVQRFGQALDLLRYLSVDFEDDYEVQFRLVEVAVRTGDLQTVSDELGRRANGSATTLPLSFAWTLAQIRLLESGGEERRGGLDQQSGRTELEQVHGGYRAPSSGIFEGAAGFSGFDLSDRMQPNRTMGSRGAFHIDRRPAFPDDDSPPVPEADAMWADNVQGQESSDSRQALPEAVTRARDFTLKHPDNYAAWYLAGCALEHVGSLHEAVEAWKRAASLEPSAISVLAVMAELQQIGVIPEMGIDYAQRFESLDRFLVHGSLETHLILYRDFMLAGEHANAIAALRTLADWLQRQNGFVPSEIETLSLLGAMRAYEISGNKEAAVACRSEVFEILNSTRQTSQNPAQMKFIAEILHQFGFELQAAECFLTLLQMEETPLDVAVQTASHLVAFCCDDRVRAALASAYRIHNGAAEIRLIQVAHSLTAAGIPIRPYVDRKNLIRHRLTRSQDEELLVLLKTALSETEDDPEIHFYMAELQMRLGDVNEARHHFETMYQQDDLNSESTLRYLYFLLKINDFIRVQEVAARALTYRHLRDTHIAEFQWALATSLFALDDLEGARRFIERCMEVDPWNGAYIALAMRIFRPHNDSSWNEVNGIILQEIEECLVSPSSALGDAQLRRWVEHSYHVMQAGFAEYAYLFARALLVICGPTNETVLELLSQAGATLNSRTVVQHILRLLNSGPAGLQVTLGQAASMASRVYTQAAQWDLAEEWHEIASRSGLDDRVQRSRLMEFSALRLTIEGRELSKARGLLEAALDVYASERINSTEAEILHAYLLVCQGESKRGMEKLRIHLQEFMSIRALYFVVKCLERTGENEASKRALIGQLMQMPPTTSLERVLLEEIYMTVGSCQAGMTAQLAC